MSDTAIRAALRAVLHRNYIDATVLHYGSFRGVVRLWGPILSTHTRSLPSPELLDIVEHEVRTLRGVKRVEMQFENVRRDVEGNWRPILQVGSIEEPVTEIELEPQAPPVASADPIKR